MTTNTVRWTSIPSATYRVYISHARSSIRYHLSPLRINILIQFIHSFGLVRSAGTTQLGHFSVRRKFDRLENIFGLLSLLWSSDTYILLVSHIHKETKWNLYLLMCRYCCLKLKVLYFGTSCFVFYSILETRLWDWFKGYKFIFQRYL